MRGKTSFPLTFTVPSANAIPIGSETAADRLLYFLLATAFTTNRLMQARPSTALTKTNVSEPMLDPQPPFGVFAILTILAVLAVLTVLTVLAGRACSPCSPCSP